MRQRKNHVYIGNTQQFLFTISEPLVASVALALSAMAVTTRVVGDGLLAAARALIQMAAERGRATALDSPLRERCRPPRKVARSSLVQFAGALHLNRFRELGLVDGSACRFEMTFRKMQGKWRSLSDRSVPTATVLSVSLLRSQASASRSYGAVSGGERLW